MRQHRSAQELSSRTCTDRIDADLSGWGLTAPELRRKQRHPHGNEKLMNSIDDGMDLFHAVRPDADAPFNPVHCLAQVKSLLAQGANPNQVDALGNTPLHRVLHVSAARKLIEAGADVNARNQDGEAPLNVWLARGPDQRSVADVVADVRFLLENGADPNVPDREGNTPLHQALSMAYDQGGWDTDRNRANNIALRVGVVQELAQFGADVNARNRDEKPPLHRAGWAPETMKVLLDLGADVEARDGRGLAMLHHVAWGGGPEQMRVLLEHGADPNAATLIQYKGEKGLFVNGATPLHLAHHGDLAELLIQFGADVEARDIMGRTPLRWHTEQSCHHHQSQFNHLLNAGADINTVDDVGLTPLRESIRFRTAGLNTVQRLLDHGADVNAGPDGTALHDAVSTRSHDYGFRDARVDDRPALVNLLLDAGGNVNARDQQGSTPLHDLLWTDRGVGNTVAVGHVLLKRGADPTLTDDEGRTPCDVAVLRGDLGAVAMLGAARREREAREFRPERPRSRSRERT